MQAIVGPTARPSAVHRLWPHGMPHRAAMALPNGQDFLYAEVANGTTITKQGSILQLPNNTNTHSQFSRNKMNNCYCSIHQNQINKYGKIRLGNYNNQDNFNDIDNTINKEDYLELECDLVEYNEKYYYINQQNIYTLIDREQNIVDVLTDDNIKKQLLIEYNKLS